MCVRNRCVSVRVRRVRKFIFVFKQVSGVPVMREFVEIGVEVNASSTFQFRSNI